MRSTWGGASPRRAALAAQLAAAWAHAFQEPWPLPGAFELAPTATAQLLRSLGIVLPRRALGWPRGLIDLRNPGRCRKFARFCTRLISVSRLDPAPSGQNPWSLLAGGSPGGAA